MSAAGADVVVASDVVFSTPEGFRPLSLDLYLPAVPAAPRAVCVYLHGGGWRVGSRRQGPGPLNPTSSRLFSRMARSGLAVASVDYRLSAEARFPAQQEDVRAACSFLDTHRAELGLGTGGLVLFGVSAGGHLAALHALTNTNGPAIHAVAAWYPVIDLAAMPDDLDQAGASADRGPSSREARFLGGAAADLPDLAWAASPVNHVTSAAPPFLLVHGDQDTAVPPRQSVRLERALAAVGAAVRLELVPGQGHMFPGLTESEVDGWVDHTTEFLLSPTGWDATLPA